MKECGNLEVKTVSINEFLYNTFHKDLSELLISDLLLVEALTIDGKSLEGKRQVISFQDLKNFKNLKYLEIANTLINNSILSILADMPYLENLIFRNCTFSKQVKNMNQLVRIRSLKIIDCNGFDLHFISALSQIQRIYLAGMKLNSFRKFRNMDLESLDVSYCSLRTLTGMKDFHTNHLIVNENQYQLIKKSKISVSFRLIVMADFREGYYIKKWVH